jgi:predicted alpha/beta superfamily hydrolase
MGTLRRTPIAALCCALVQGCSNTPSPAPPAAPMEAEPSAYVLENTEVRHLESSSLKRDYQVFVSLPSSYGEKATHRFPVMFVTDATYAFPLIRSIARRVGDHGAGLEEFILIGLSYAEGETPEYSRRRDYTPTINGDKGAVSDMPGRVPVYGEAEAYRRFILNEVFPLVARNYRVDMHRKIYVGHSYGGLFGAYILLTDPAMFERYVISSPSLWFDSKAILARERDYAATHKDLTASVFFAVGAYETINPASHDERYNHTQDLVRDLQAFEAQLQSRGYPSLHVESIVLADEDHLTVYPSAITRALKWALRPLKAVDAAY